MSTEKTGFLTDLQVRRTVDNEQWVLTQPLIWKGDWETLYIKPGFTTDFASVPKVLRWLLDTGGKNAAAGVLHDVTWRESMARPETRRVDPWHADGLFRRALRYADVAPVPRNMLWVGVRVAASIDGRLGQRGPSVLAKLGKMIMWGLIALLVIGVPVLAIGIGYVIYLIIGWLAAPFALLYKAKRERGGDDYDPHQVLPRLVADSEGEDDADGACIRQLLVIPTKESDQLLVESDAELQELLDTYLGEIEADPHAHWQTLDSARALQQANQC